MNLNIAGIVPGRNKFYTENVTEPVFFDDLRVRYIFSAKMKRSKGQIHYFSAKTKRSKSVSLFFVVLRELNLPNTS